MCRVWFNLATTRYTGVRVLGSRRRRLRSAVHRNQVESRASRIILLELENDVPRWAVAIANLRVREPSNAR